MGISIVLTQYTFRWWLNPAFIEQENKKKIKRLSKTIQYLEKELNDQNDFIILLQKNIKSGVKLTQAEKELNEKDELEEKPEVISDKDPVNIGYQKNLRYTILNNFSYFENTTFFSPVNGVISSKFDRKTRHFGIDIVSKENEPIKAIEDGVVLDASWSVEYGYVIIIQHKNNLISVYKHNSALLKKIGNYVKKGDAIAIIGNSGELSSGPHLHFEIWHNESPIDPEKYINL